MTETISTDDGIIQSGGSQAEQQLPVSGPGGKLPSGMVDPRLTNAVDDTSEQTRRGGQKVGEGIGRTKKDSAGKTDIDKGGAADISKIGGVLSSLGQGVSGALGSMGQAGQNMPQMPQVPASSAGQANPMSLSDPTAKNAISKLLGGSDSAVGSGIGSGLTGAAGGSGKAGPTSIGKNQFQQNILDLAKQVVSADVTYAWGGGDNNGPTQGIRDGGAADAAGDFNKVGFDCQGLAKYLIFQSSGVSIPNGSGNQFGAGYLVGEPEIGDLAFPTDPGKHVQVYVGDGMVVEAQQSGTNVMFSNATPGSQFVRVVDAA